MIFDYQQHLEIAAREAFNVLSTPQNFISSECNFINAGSIITWIIKGNCQGNLFTLSINITKELARSEILIKWISLKLEKLLS